MYDTTLVKCNKPAQFYSITQQGQYSRCEQEGYLNGWAGRKYSTLLAEQQQKEVFYQEHEWYNNYLLDVRVCGDGGQVSTAVAWSGFALLMFWTMSNPQLKDPSISS